MIPKFIWKKKKIKIANEKRLKLIVVLIVWYLKYSMVLENRLWK